MKNFSILFFLFIFTIIPTYSQVTINVPGDYPTIQVAIDAANNGDIVLVADGTYYENIDFKGKAITVASHFLNDGNEAHIANTIINGSQPSHPDSGSCVYFINGEDTTSVLCGFTITGGTGTLSLDFGDVSGGGIYSLGSGGTMKNNIIENNTVNNNASYANGGGIVFDFNGLGLIIENNLIRNNTVTGNEWSTGGGIAIFDWSYTSYARVVNNIIINNTVMDPNFATGGGIEINGGSNEFFVIGNYIKGNMCSGGVPYGGGLDLYDCSPTVKNNLIVENSAESGGGLVLDAVVTTTSKSKLSNSGRIPNRYNRQNANQFNSSKTLLAAVFENNTIVNNSATLEGGGLSIWNTSSPQLMNFIVWGNTAPTDPNVSGTADIQYSDIEGGYTGTGNIDVNPEFDPSWEFYAFLSSSLCIDAGNPSAMYNDFEDPNNPGNPLWPALGALTNDMGHCGGPASLWGQQEWPIPVELISFTAIVNGYDVNLSWSTATETNNMGFEVQRSSNATDFRRIAFIEGRGTVSEVQNYSFIDKKREVGAYTYRLKQIDFDGSSEFSDVVEVEILVPNVYALDQNFPNPFNPTTIITFYMPERSQVFLKIFNSIGEQVTQLVNEEKPAGRYEIQFSAEGLPSEVYYYQLKAGSFIETKKMILLK